MIRIFVCFYVVQGAPDFLGLVTANTVLWNKYVWNILTAALYEESILRVIIDVAFIAMAAPTNIDYLPYDQFGLYMLITTLLTTLSTSFYCIIRFFSTGRESMVLEPIYGCSGLIVTLLMFSRKHLGKTPIFSLPKTGGAMDYLSAPISKLTYNNMPIIIICALLLCWFLRLRWLALDASFAITGCLISWVYLKFYYRNEDGSYGTPAEEFAFVNMFPEPLHMVLVPLTTAFYNIGALVGVLPELPKTDLPTYVSNHHLRGPHVSEFSSASTSAFTSAVGLDNSNNNSSHSRLGHLTNLPENTSAPQNRGAVTGDEPPALSLPAPDALMERRKAKALKMLDAKMVELSRPASAPLHD